MRKRLLVSSMIGGLMLVALSVPVLGAPGGVTNPTTQRELAQARQATAQYQNAEIPVAEGVVGPYKELLLPTGLPVGRLSGIGYRYRVDPPFPTTFDPAIPQVLFYDDAGGGRRLIGVAYLVKSGDLPPEGFTGSDDVWSHFQPDGITPFTTGVWRLHAWIWEGNPDGIFATFNPNIP